LVSRDREGPGGVANTLGASQGRHTQKLAPLNLPNPVIRTLTLVIHRNDEFGLAFAQFFV